MGHLTRVFVFFALLCGATVPALAQDVAPADTGLTAAATAEAETFIKGKHNRVRAVLRKPDTPKRAEELTVLLGEFLDYERLAQLSLANEWNKHSKRELDKFVSLLRQLVERQYQRNMESTLEYKVSWVGTEALDEGVKVKSSARSTRKRRQPPITIDYSMSPDGDEWKAYDIFTDDVSLVRNYKRQFRRVIKEEGWNGLIGRMEKKLAAEDELI